MPSHRSSYAGRTPYPFGPSLYQLCVQKVKVQPARRGGPSPRHQDRLRSLHPRTRRTFGALRTGSPRRVRHLDFHQGWDLGAPGRGRTPAGGPGAPACLNGDDDVEKILLGCWIEGRPGQADPEGFNSLVDYRSITPPPLWTPSGSPPAATPGPAPETDAPPRPGARNPLRDARPLDSPPEQDDPEPDVPERAPGPEPCLNAKPRWDAILRVLTWNNKPVGAYARLAPNQAMILSAFEEEGWPTRIDDPLPRGRLRQTLKDLQKKFKDAPITFRETGPARGSYGRSGKARPRTHPAGSAAHPRPGLPRRGSRQARDPVLIPHSSRAPTVDLPAGAGIIPLQRGDAASSA